MKDTIAVTNDLPVAAESILENILENILKIKENNELLTQFIDTQCFNKETLILCGMAGKHLNKPELVKYALNKLQEESKQKNFTESQEWAKAEIELHKWLATIDGKEPSIFIKNHLKTTRLEISLIVACMDRQEHLIQTLPTWFSVPQIKEFIVTDFNSKIPLSTNPIVKEWIKQQKIRILRVEDEKHFNLGKAYNLAADFASCDKLLKIDCDYMCIDPSWFDRLDNMVYDSAECYFIRGDWRFGRSMSGLLFCDKKDFVYYREDLNGWGFDDLDLCRRIVETKPRIKEVIWPDAGLYVKHLTHDDKERTSNYLLKDKLKTNANNRLICHQPVAPINRARYNVLYKNNEINTKFVPNKALQHGFCVTLKDKPERWDQIKLNVPPFIRKFEAIDTRKNPALCSNYNLTVRPSTITYSIYFKGGNGAVGCYLSHYLIWQQIVKENLSHALIIEDDADTTSLNEFLQNMPINIDSYEFIQLNKRFSYVKPEHRMMFHGTESYIVSYQGAKKLIKATQHPSYLEYVFHNDPPNVKLAAKRLKIKQPNRVYEPNSIIAPADKFITMCCDPKCDPEVKLSYLNYPCVEVNQEYAASDIDGGMGHIWKMSPDQVEKQINNTKSSFEYYL